MSGFVRLTAVLIGVSVLAASAGHARPPAPVTSQTSQPQAKRDAVVQACVARCGAAPTSGEYSRRCTYYQAVYSNRRCRAVCIGQSLSPVLERQTADCSRACAAGEPNEPDTGVPERCVPLVNSLASG